MGFSFNFFGTQEVRKFSYKPRFYDPEAEERNTGISQNRRIPNMFPDSMSREVSVTAIIRGPRK